MKTKKYTLKAQMLRMLAAYARTSAIFILFSLMMLPIWVKTAGDIVISVFGLFSAIFTIYGVACKSAEDDKKSYTQRSAKLTNALLLPIILLIVNVLVIIMYTLAWKFGSDGESLTGMLAVILNFIVIAWFSPTHAFMGFSNGVIGVFGYIIAIVLPIAISVLGYIAGLKGFDIYSKIDMFTYEKKKK